MEIERNEWVCGINEKYGEEILVETSINTAERGGIKKVLSLEAEGGVLGTELMREEAEVSGRVNFRLLYLDRQERLCGLDYFKDFKCRVKGDKIAPEGECFLDVTATEAESRILGDGVDLSATVDLSLRYFGEEKLQKVASVSEGEAKRESILCEKVAKEEKSLTLQKSENSGPDVKKILLFGADVLPGSISEQEAMTEVTGEVRASIVYLSQADEAVEKTLLIPFAERFEGRVDECIFSVADARIILTGDEEGSEMEAEVTISITALSYEKTEEECLTAICGEKSEVIETFSRKEGDFFKGQYVFSEKIAGAIPSSVAGAYVSFVRPGCHAVANLSVEDGAVSAEGVASFQVILLTEGGYDAVQGELPFVFRLPLSDASVGKKGEIRLSIGAAKATLSGKDLLIEADVRAVVSLFEEASIEYLSDAKEGDPLPESEAGVSVYFAESGEDVWKIAKSMGVLPSALLKANPFLEEPIVESKKVLIFRNK